MEHILARLITGVSGNCMHMNPAGSGQTLLHPAAACLQTNVPAAAPAAGACGAPGGEPAAKKKRSLEDLMGDG